MAAIITEKFRQSSATAFKNSFGTDKYYMFVGKSQPWTSEGATSDSLPPSPVDSVAPEIAVDTAVSVKMFVPARLTVAKE